MKISIIQKNFFELKSFQITLVVGNRLKPIDSELKEVNENELKSDNMELAIENEETTSIH